MKVALYARVSTEEQARHGLSIDTQLDNLRHWATVNGHTVVGEYVDPGISARKAPTKRPALQQLLSELDKVELIAFTKLDRWTRNIKGYYDVQAVLDAHKVAWAAIQEDYETVTAAGRFKVNIMLSVAENEADRTSERIKVVFERKLAQGEYIGNRVPLGYSVEGKRLVPNDDADTVRNAFEVYRKTGSVYQVLKYLHDAGHDYVYVSAQRILRNKIYIGIRGDNDRYCEPIIPMDVFADVQRLLDNRSIRQNPSQRVYLFSGLIRCADCGKTMAGSCAKEHRLRYRCNNHNLNGLCPNQHIVKERDLESWLLDNIATELQAVSARQESRKKKKRGPDKAAVMAKIDRLKELYVDGIIEKEQFMMDRAKLLAQIPEYTPAINLSAARRIVLSKDFRERYNELSREDKRTLWRSLVDHVVADREGKYAVYFSP